MPIFILYLLMFVLIFAGEATAEDKRLSPGLYAVMETNRGTITLQLFEKEAPKTVEKFVSLSEGTREWVDPKTMKRVKRPLYDGLIFHRVIPGFMIQGGDPMGNGAGGPGYEFGDEFSPLLRFDRPGRLAMANAGPNTNGSQFFITEGPTEHLNNRHTIFGQVIQGQEVVHKIATVSTDRMDRPREPVIIKTIKINRVQ